MLEDKNMQIRATENTEEFGRCGCGRSPTGKCIGWHSLSEEAYQKALLEYKEFDEKVVMKEEFYDLDDDLEAYKRQAQELWNDSCTSPRKN
jgi:hypothetical protein